MINDIPFTQFYDIYKKYGRQGAEDYVNQFYSNGTGFAGQVPKAASDSEKLEWGYKINNAPERLQAIGQQNNNADHDRAMAEQFANSAYKDLDPGPMQMQGIAAMVNNLGQQQPFRNEPMQGFRNLFLALRGR